MCSCNIILEILYILIAVISYFGWIFYLGIALEDDDYECKAYQEMSNYTLWRWIGALSCMMWVIVLPLYILYITISQISSKLNSITELGKTLKNKGKEND